MSTEHPTGFHWRLALTLWLLGLPGVVAAAVLALPRLLPPGPLPAPLPELMLAAVLQSAVLLALSASAGTLAAARVGLRSPLLEAWLGRGRGVPAGGGLSLAPGVVGGVLGAGLLVLLPSVAPPALQALQARGEMPLAVKLLYGGVTEEILVRWGLMSVILWALWRGLQRGAGTPRPVRVAAAVVLSATLFGLGHLPAAGALVGALDAPLVLYVVAANAVFGLVAGYLFWKHGLESAILAHVLAHALGHALAPA